MAVTVWILYQGIPRVMQPDPTHAFGIYFSAMIVVVLTSGLARLITGMYLLGYMDLQHSWLTHKIAHLLRTMTSSIPMNSSIETELLSALTQLAEAVKLMPTANPKPNLLPFFSRLDELAQTASARHRPDAAALSAQKKLRESAAVFARP